MRSSKLGSRIERLATALVAATSLALFAAAPAAAATSAVARAPTDPFSSNIFTPEFSVCTTATPCHLFSLGVDADGNFLFPQDDEGNFIGVDYAGTTRAGANPQLAIRMRKAAPNHCPNFANVCAFDEVYMEQVLKKIAIHLPPGLLGDINAAPYCEPEQRWVGPPESSVDEPNLRWFCKNPDAFVGAGIVYVSQCLLQGPSQDIWCVDEQVPPMPSGILMTVRLLLYNDRPRAGEQGHLVVMIADESTDPAYTATRFNSRGIDKIDIGITARGDLTLDAVADNLPDPVEFLYRNPNNGCGYGDEPPCASLGFTQIVDMAIILNGATGKERGHPFLRNPTFCDPQEVEAELQGYAHNGISLQGGNIARPAYGDGITVRDAAPYQATGCDSVPYDPKLQLTLGTTEPGKAPAISATVSQSPDEATTDKTTVTFPKAFKINDKNTATHCPEELIQAAVDGTGDCPESSRIGTVEASSVLLPEGETLKGNVYLAGLTGDSIKVSAVLKGFVTLRIDAKGRLGDDLTIVNNFDDLPAAPIGEFRLNLEGGDKGLIKNPRVCGPQTIASSFTSHSGKQVDRQIPVDISGCKDPVLDVELSNPRKGKPTDLDASISSTGTSIESVDLRLDRHLKWGKRKARMGKKLLTQAGTASFATLDGTTDARLTAKATRRGSLAFAPLTRTRQGQQVSAAVPGFSATLFHGPARAARNARRDLSAKFPKSALGMAGLPGDDLTAVELNLLGQSKRRPVYLKNPLGCKKPLNFVAIVKTKRGATLALKDQVRLKGKGCPKKKRKR